MALPTKNEIAVTERVISQVPRGIYDALMHEIKLRNERLNDDADAAFYVPYGLEAVTEILRKEREGADAGKAKSAKEPKPGKPDLHAVQHAQSA